MEQKYKQAFSKLKASPEKIQEVINMTEAKKPRKIVRRLLVTAIIMALAVLTAMGANAASGGELFAQIISYVEYTTQDGTQVAEMEIKLDDGALASGGVGEFEVIQNEDGKAYMTYTDEDGNKVTKEIRLDELEGTASQVQSQVQSQMESQIENQG